MKWKASFQQSASCGLLVATAIQYCRNIFNAMSQVDLEDGNGILASHFSGKSREMTVIGNVLSEEQVGVGACLGARRGCGWDS